MKALELLYIFWRLTRWFLTNRFPCDLKDRNEQGRTPYIKTPFVCHIIKYCNINILCIKISKKLQNIYFKFNIRMTENLNKGERHTWNSICESYLILCIKISPKLQNENIILNLIEWPKIWKKNNMLPLSYQREWMKSAVLGWLGRTDIALPVFGLFLKCILGRGSSAWLWVCLEPFWPLRSTVSSDLMVQRPYVLKVHINRLNLVPMVRTVQLWNNLKSC